MSTQSAYPLVVKLVFTGVDGNTNVHRFRCTAQELRLSGLHKHIGRILTRYPDGVDIPHGWDARGLHITYKDDEGDTISVGTESDVAAAVDVVLSERRKVLRMSVTGHDHAVATATSLASPVHATRSGTSVSFAAATVPACGLTTPVLMKDVHVEVVEDGRDHVATAVPETKVADPVGTCFVARSLNDAHEVHMPMSLGMPAVIQKTFRLRNEGTDQWPVGVRLKHVGGDRMGAPVVGVPVPRAMPGETVSVRVTFMHAATTPGSVTTSEWRLWAPSKASPCGGFRFGYRVWLDVHVHAAGATQQGVGSFLPVNLV